MNKSTITIDSSNRHTLDITLACPNINNDGSVTVPINRDKAAEVMFQIMDKFEFSEEEMLEKAAQFAVDNLATPEATH